MRLKLTLILIILSLCMSAEAVTRQEVSENKKLISSAKELMLVDQFNGATLCGFVSLSLGNSGHGEQHSGNAFNIGLNEGFDYPEVMTAMAFLLQTYKARLDAYADGLIDGFKQAAPTRKHPPAYKTSITNMMLDRWHESNKCSDARVNSRY